MLRLVQGMTSRRALLLSLIGALVIGACGGGVYVPPAASPTAEISPAASPAARAQASPSPTVAPTPTPTVRWPLNGLIAEDASKVKRRPLNVRFPNDPGARPLVGLAKADLVFEMIVEGGITRYAAIYHSRDSTSVGPVRSYRFSDLHLTQLLRAALVASGATIEETDAVTRSVRAGNMISVDAVRYGGPYFRVGGRANPNNLFANLEIARQAVNEAGGKDPVDVPPLAFLPSVDHDPTAGGFVGSVGATTVTIPFQRDPVTFTWDEGSKGYRRTQAGVRTVDPDGSVPILARNVVVMHTDIWLTTVVQDIFGSLGLDYRMTGGGRASIFRDGRRQDGTWRRDGALDQFTFWNAAGEQISLSPGQSWMHFLYQDWVVPHSP